MILIMLCAKGTKLRKSWHTYDNSSGSSEKHRKTDNNIGMVPSTSQIGGEVGSSEHDRIQMTTHPSSTFQFTPSMLRMDEIMG
jgi:hypothetical protein